MKYSRIIDTRFYRVPVKKRNRWIRLNKTCDTGLSYWSLFMHGLIFETKRMLLAESTRLLSQCFCHVAPLPYCRRRSSVLRLLGRNQSTCRVVGYFRLARNDVTQLKVRVCRIKRFLIFWFGSFLFCFLSLFLPCVLFRTLSMQDGWYISLLEIQIVAIVFGGSYS